MLTILLSAALAHPPSLPSHSDSAIWQELAEIEQLHLIIPEGLSWADEDAAMKRQYGALRDTLYAFEEGILGVDPSTDGHDERLAALGLAYEHAAHVMETTTYGQKPFQSSLTDKAYVQEEKAIRRYQALLDRAHERGGCDEWGMFAIDRMQALRPDDYGPWKRRVPRGLSPRLEQAYGLLVCNNYDDAARLAQGTTKNDRLLLAIVSHYRGDTGEAERHFDILRQRFPSDPVIAVNAAYFYVLGLQDPSSALKALNTAVAKNRKLPDTDPVFEVRIWAKAAQLRHQAEQTRQRAYRIATEAMMLKQEALILEMDLLLRRARTCPALGADLLQYGEYIMGYLQIADGDEVDDLGEMVLDFEESLEDASERCP